MDVLVTPQDPGSLKHTGVRVKWEPLKKQVCNAFWVPAHRFRNAAVGALYDSDVTTVGSKLI